MRLFCFPHAGGSSAAFHAWTAALPSWPAATEGCHSRSSTMPMCELLLPIIRADLTAFETYTFTEEPPLGCAITAMRGRWHG